MAILKINGDTSGSVSLTVPATAGTNTVTVPAETGTVLTTASSGVCRAWVNFNGTGTVAIRASFNVSSITDNGVGDYTVNFTNAMQDANYGVSGTSRQETGGGSGPWGSFINIKQGTTLSTTSVRIVPNIIANSSWVGIGGGSYDSPEMCISIFR